jgi:hypothetical protein
MQEDDVPTVGIMRLANQSAAFDFWQEKAEDIYSLGIQYVCGKVGEV